jgi:PAS domain-containing protein
MNYQEIFYQLPVNCLLLDTKLRILDASEGFYTLSGSSADIIGQYIFDPFPMNEYTKQSDPEHNHLRSLEIVLSTKQHDRMPIQRYDLKLPESHGGNFISKWWQIDNYPIIDSDGEVVAIAKIFEDVTHMIEKIHDMDEAVAKAIFRTK